ncbi:sensor histidine kinase [Angustibacter aerolatus]
MWSVGTVDAPGTSAPQPSPVAPSARERPGDRRAVDTGPIGRWRPLLFGSPWLIYLLYPVAAIWDRPAGVRWLGLGALLLFAACFVLGIATVGPARRGQPGALRRVVVVLAAMLLLLSLAAPAAGDNVVAGLIYVGVLATMTLPTRAAVAVVTLLAVSAEVVPRVVPGWQADNFFAFQVLVSCFAAWGITQVISRNAELVQAREQIQRLAVAEERGRMARDLHDILGHSLTVITIKAELAGRMAQAEGAERAGAEIADVERLAREALADVRSTIGGMRGVTLASELAGARTALEAAGIRADLPSAVEAVPSRWRELYAWAVREGVTNVVRHSGATSCVVRLGPRAVEIEDDGCGPSADASGRRQGHGLDGLRERVAREGARLVVGPAAGHGFLLRVEVPA